MRKSWLLPILFISAAAAQGHPLTGEQPATPPSRGDVLLQSTMLTLHNAARASVRQPPLIWDARLAAEALAYARDMARTERFEHSKQRRDAPLQGENLWSGSRGAYRYDEMAKPWIDEKRFFVNRPAPDFSTTGDDNAVSHYVQIIWARTTRFGCAMASNARDDYLVCRYLTAGKVLGERALP